MTELPRLELTEDPNKKNDYIIYRYSSKTDTRKIDTKKKRGTKKTKSSTKRGKSSTKKGKSNTKKGKSNTKKKRTIKGFFNIF